VPRRNHKATIPPTPLSKIGIWPESPSTLHSWPDGPPPPDRVAFPGRVAAQHPRRQFAGHPEMRDKPAAKTAARAPIAAAASRGDAILARARADAGRPVSWADGLALLAAELAAEAA
jgi:hypothetical protein